MHRRGFLWEWKALERERENGAQWGTPSSNGGLGEPLHKGEPWSHGGSAQAREGVSTSVPGQGKHNLISKQEF